MAKIIKLLSLFHALITAPVHEDNSEYSTPLLVFYGIKIAQLRK